MVLELAMRAGDYVIRALQEECAQSIIVPRLCPLGLDSAHGSADWVCVWGKVGANHTPFHANLCQCIR